MLPERLCNFICSLRPDEEKLAYSVIFNMNEKAEIKDYRIRHTVIKSNRRFTYEEAQNIIETGEGDYKEEILQLNKLAQILREKRMAAGAINFDRCEVKFEIDEKGKPLSVYFKVSKEDSDKLKEEIRAYFGDAEKLTYFGDTVATYKNSVRKTFDKTMLFAAHPELIEEQEKYTKESETRTLLIKLK
jgi:exoribonuclease R